MTDKTEKPAVRSWTVRKDGINRTCVFADIEQQSRAAFNLWVALILDGWEATGPLAPLAELVRQDHREATLAAIPEPRYSPSVH